MNPTNYKRLKTAGLASINLVQDRLVLIKARFDTGLGTRFPDRLEHFSMEEVIQIINDLTTQLEDIQEIQTDAQILLDS